MKTLLFFIWAILFCSFAYSAETNFIVGAVNGGMEFIGDASSNAPNTMFLMRDSEAVAVATQTADTNSVIFVLANLRATNSGAYSLVASNAAGTRTTPFGTMIIRESFAGTRKTAIQLMTQ